MKAAYSHQIAALLELEHTVASCLACNRGKKRFRCVIMLCAEVLTQAWSSESQFSSVVPQREENVEERKLANGKEEERNPANGKEVERKPASGKEVERKPANGKEAERKPANGKRERKPANGKAEELKIKELEMHLTYATSKCHHQFEIS